MFVPRVLVLLAPLAVAACIPWSPATFRGWPEPPHKFVDCSGAPNGATACFERARALCPEGYQLAEHRTDPPINRNQIIVRCGPPLAVEEPPAPAPVVRRRAPAQPVPK
jgi:hypothetical protein